MTSSTPTRVLGALTAAYGAYTLWRPRSLLRVAGLEDPDRPAEQQPTTLGLAIGARDLLSGVSMLLARPGRALQAATAVRVACDVGDAIGFGIAVPPRHRGKVIAVAAGWGLICAASLPGAARSR